MSRVAPTIAIVVPVKNDASRLKVCLDSLNSQHYPRDYFEIIVVDNGSTDDSASVAAQSGATVLHYPALSVGALRNRGVSASHTAVLAFVDSDHEVPHDWLARGAAALQCDSRICAVGAPCLAPPNGTWVQRFWQVHRLRLKDVQEVDWLGAGNLFVRRSAFDQTQGFREELIAAEDVDLCLRLTSHGGKIVSDPQITNIHHGEPATLWQFGRKEYWRGSSGVRAFIKQGLPLRELPSLLYPAYHLLVTICLVATATTLFWHRSLAAVLLFVLALVTPATLLSVLTSWRRGQMHAFFPLAALYLTYGLARAAALFRR